MVSCVLLHGCRSVLNVWNGFRKNLVWELFFVLTASSSSWKGINHNMTYMNYLGRTQFKLAVVTLHFLLSLCVQCDHVATDQIQNGKG